MNDLPFGEEDRSFDITWDGNVEGLLSAESPAGISFYKVSDVTPTIEMLNGATLVFSKNDGTFGEAIVSEGNFTDFGDVLASEGIIICHKAPYEINGMVVPEIGTYFVKINGDYYDRLCNHIVDIKTIDPKYLPSGVGGMRIIVTEEYDESTDTTTYSADKTYDEITDAILAGVSPHCVVCEDGRVYQLARSAILKDSLEHASSSPYHQFTCVMVGTLSTLTIYSGNNIDLEFNA